MNTPSHAGGHRGFPAAVRLALLLLSGALALATSLLAFATARIARRVVTPAPRVYDTRIVKLDTAAQTITLDRTPDTRLPGRYGLFTTGSARYLRLGSVLAETDTTVTRKLLTHIDRTAHLDADAAFSGWYYDRPEQLRLAFSPELIGSPVGPCPAWFFPAETPNDLWVVQVHGRGTTKAEALRAVPVFHEVGIPSLLVSYRNDGDAPRTRSGASALGAVEWRDVDAAIAFAKRRGARRFVIMGWSMGGAIAMQLALSSPHRDAIVGVVLDSPVIDWRLVLNFQASLLRVPRTLAGLALGALSTQWASPATGADGRIPFERLDVVSRARELTHPTLILHSDDDGYVPSAASHDLVVARPDLVTIETFDHARHTKLWNYDQDRWGDAIHRWLVAQGLVVMHAATDG